MMRLILTLALLLTACTTVGQTTISQTEAPADGRELVVLVHGMGRTPLSMAPLDWSLRRAGYRTLNVGYSSQGPDVETLAEGLAAAVHAETARAPAPRVHFVAHSLGGVLSRWVLARDPPTAAGRLVLLASPIAGSASADAWAPWLRWTLTPIVELGTDAPFDPGTLPPGTEVAVIAGDADGKVSPQEACLPGGATRIIPSGHTAIMWRPRTARLVKTFLADGTLPGSFACDAAPAAG